MGISQSGLKTGFVVVAIVVFFFFIAFLLLGTGTGRVGVFDAILHNDDTPPYEYYAVRSANDDALRKCELKEFPDGWTDEALSIVNPYRDPLANCNRNFTPLTELVDSRVRLVKKSDSDVELLACRARSILWKTDSDYSAGNWVNISEKRTFPHDAVHVQCAKDSGVELLACRARSILWKTDSDYSAGNWVNISEKRTFPHDAVHVQCAKEPTNFTDRQIIYSFVHQQIYLLATCQEVNQFIRNRSSEVEKERAAISERERKRAVRPSVHVILLDSLGDTALLRAMPRTVGFLKGELGAVNFRHINKVGEDSRSNGVAFLLGMQLVDFDRSLLGLPSVPADYNSSFFCRHLDIDAQKMVIREFEKQRGYVSMLSDDWSQGVFNYPDCKGYQKMPSTNYNRPYQLLRDMDKAVAKIMSVKNCMPPWLAQLQYLEQFIKEYSDVPKTSLSWLVTLAHNNNDNAFGVDGLFHDFLAANRNEFGESFVFFMSDSCAQ